LTAADVLRVIETVAVRFDGTVQLGAGTAIEAADVARVRDTGATYVVTPAMAPFVEAPSPPDCRCSAGH
jgi:2-dehydro-3-deoxyphosphogluconate aldolase/(4S)-4-hydroxy-2-oxoglutarate aldolase